MSVEYYKEQIRRAKADLAYANRRVQGVETAMNTTTNKAVSEALNTELKELQKQIKKCNRTISDSEYEIQRLIGR